MRIKLHVPAIACGLLLVLMVEPLPNEVESREPVLKRTCLGGDASVNFHKGIQFFLGVLPEQK
jgi:hypothetical protein